MIGFTGYFIERFGDGGAEKNEVLRIYCYSRFFLCLFKRRLHVRVTNLYVATNSCIKQVGMSLFILCSVLENDFAARRIEPHMNFGMKKTFLVYFLASRLTYRVTLFVNNV